MSRIIFNDRDLDIDIEKCVSVFDVRSASGKSYISYATRNIPGRPKMVLLSNDIDYRYIVTRGWSDDPDTIYIFDRYAFFRNADTDKMLENSVDICALLDVKDLSIVNNLHCHTNNVLITRESYRRFVLKNSDLLRKID